MLRFVLLSPQSGPNTMSNRKKFTWTIRMAQLRGRIRNEGMSERPATIQAILQVTS